MSDSTAASLIAQLRTGQPEAFTAIYRAESPIVYGYLLRLTRQRDVAADLFQNVWLKLVAHAPTLAPATRIGAWLLTVAHNEVRSHQRWNRWDASRVLLFARSTVSDVAVPSDEGLDVQRALERLDVADRETLLLEAVSELDSDDLCTILGISPAAWRKRLSRARSRLNALLSQPPLTYVGAVMTLQSPSLSNIGVAPPARLAARTEQLCLTNLRPRTHQRTRRTAVHVLCGEWLVYATSILICCTYAVQMTWSHVNEAHALATLEAR